MSLKFNQEDMWYNRFLTAAKAQPHLSNKSAQIRHMYCSKSVKQNVAKWGAIRKDICLYGSIVLNDIIAKSQVGLWSLWASM